MNNQVTYIRQKKFRPPICVTLMVSSLNCKTKILAFILWWLKNIYFAEKNMIYSDFLNIFFLIWDFLRFFWYLSFIFTYFLGYLKRFRYFFKILFNFLQFCWASNTLGYCWHFFLSLVVKIILVTTKSYFGYYWTPTFLWNVQKQHHERFLIGYFLFTLICIWVLK